MNLKTIADQFGMSEIDALTSESESAKMVRVMTAHHQFMNQNSKYRNVIQKMQFRSNSNPCNHKTLKGQKEMATQILEQMAKYLDVGGVEYITSNAKNNENVWSRYAFIQLCLSHLTLNLSQIGNMINRDHSTVTHGKRKHNELMGDDEYNQFYTRLTEYCAPLTNTFKSND